jgi:hypothetical protein
VTGRSPGDDEVLRLANRQRLQQHRVHRAKDRAVGSDRERQRHERRDGEAGRLQQQPERVSDISKQVHVITLRSSAQRMPAQRQAT